MLGRDQLGRRRLETSGMVPDGKVQGRRLELAD
jgi:hypothetical protein